ncbi:60s ribosomal protein l32-like [Lynx pardinus]|uniref:60S ribosomal protein L32 n=2 Tax=Lynx TaxID=13124 RepID=A0A485N2U4_LYNPA|nr:60s ribosomal protein l32-like [Lynx pardinus]
MPSTGYGSVKKAKHVLPSGFWKFRVHNARELEVLLMRSKSHCAGIVYNVSPPETREAMVERTAQLSIRVTSPDARLHDEEK